MGVSSHGDEEREMDPIAPFVIILVVCAIIAYVGIWGGFHAGTLIEQFGFGTVGFAALGKGLSMIGIPIPFL